MATTTSEYLSFQRRLDRMAELKRKMDWQMDEETLLAKLKETAVTQYSAREYTHWHFEEALELLEGPLRNPSLLTIALKTKFFSRLFSFLKPQKGLFSRLKNSPERAIYVRVACQLFEVLTDNDVGKNYLLEHPLLKHIGDMFAAEIQRNSSTIPTTTTISSSSTSTSTLSNVEDEDTLLSRNSLLKLMSREYFTLLGVLSRTERGQEVLRRHRLYKYLIKLCELEGRDDLVHLILTSLDYNKTIPNELARIFASSSSLPPTTTTTTTTTTTSKDKDKEKEGSVGAITSEQMPTLSILRTVLSLKSPVVRYLAVRHLRLLIKPDQTWPIDLLVTKLHDSDSKIRTLALSLLDEAIDHRTCLEHFIDLIIASSSSSGAHSSSSSSTSNKTFSSGGSGGSGGSTTTVIPTPTTSNATESNTLAVAIDLHYLMSLGSAGTALLIRCLSCPKGLTKLLQANFVKPQMEHWFTVENEQYVLALERKLQQVLTRPLTRSAYRDTATRFVLLLSLALSLYIHTYIQIASNLLTNQLKCCFFFLRWVV
jgi:uncharacterized membrane protein YgcG